MTNNFRFRTSFLLLLLLASGVLAFSLRAKPKGAPQYPVQRSLYAAYHLQAEATLTVSNSTMHEVTLRPEVYGQDGREHELDAIVLAAHGQKNIDLTGHLKDSDQTSGGAGLC